LEYPTHRAVTASEAIAADREAVEAHRIPPLVLMEHAGRGLAVLVASYPEALEGVTVLCGPGNNGGDGYACARFLAGWGYRTALVRAFGGVPASGEARLERELALATGASEVAVATPADLDVLSRAIRDAGVVVDALLGVGLSTPMRAPFPALVERVNSGSALRIAADVPSGLHSDTGEPLPVAVRADVTAAMGLVKVGCTTERGAPFCGRVVEVDVGWPAAVHRRFLARDARARD
jgi:NAD(P)H-hydrate epimerase